MIKKSIQLIIVFLCIHSLFAADSSIISLAYYIPYDEADYYESASFSIGASPFDFDSNLLGFTEENSVEYSPLDVFSQLDESGYSPRSMVKEKSLKKNRGEKVGSKWKGASVSIDDENTVYINATCVYESNHAYFYVDDSIEYDISDFITTGKEFDSSYEMIIPVFGHEADVDGNGKIRFLITNFDEDTMGFYYPLDQYSNTELWKAEIDYVSNESDVLYINSLIFSDDELFDIADVYSTLAHEFSHMAYMNNRERQDLMEETSMWINEGLAMWCESYVGLPVGHADYIHDYLYVADEIGLFESERSEIYGYGLLFFRYIEEAFGLDAIIDIINSRYTGTEAIADAIGYPFEDIFTVFVYCLLATATYSDPEFYLEGLNDVEKGFVLSDEVLYILDDYENYYNLEDGYAFHTDYFNPFSISFFITDSVEDTDFESEKAEMIYVEVEWESE